jgi:hypothetical protein
MHRPDLDLVRVEEVSWNKTGIEASDDYAFCMEMYLLVGETEYLPNTS